MNLITQAKCLNVVVELVMGYSEHIVMARSYGVLKPGRDKIDVFLRNHSAKQIILSKQTAVGEWSSQHHSGSVGAEANRA